MTLAAGARLGPYRIKSLVGAGGMGHVYRAHDDRLDRDVAIKVLRPEVQRDQERLRRFEQEARAAGSLNHPNIVAVHAFETGPDSPFLVTEFLDGQTLQQLIATHPPQLARTLDMGVQLARGLGAAHARGIVHRDLKPANVFLTGDGQVKILDFGVARLDPPTEAPPGATLSVGVQTATGAVMGTAGYMAPEQVQGHPADQRSDLFSVGAILYELISGRRAFDGETPVDRAFAILRSDPAPLTTAAGAPVPAAVERVVRRCLEKSPAQRFQSAFDLAFAIEALIDDSRTPSTPAAPLLPARRRLRPLSLTLAAGVALVASVAGFTVGRRAKPKAAPTLPAERPPPSFQRVSFRSGTAGNGRFAPDGNTVVYNGRFEGAGMRVMANSLGAPEGRPLTEPGAWILALSSRGEMALALQRSGDKRDQIATLARAPLSGGAPRAVIENVPVADFTPDGEELAVARVVGSRVRVEFPVDHVVAETDGWIESLRVSRDGQRVAFHHQPVRGDDRGSVEVIDRAGKRTLLTDGWYTMQGVAWSAAGDEVLFAGSRASGLRAIHAVSLSGKVREVLSAPTNLRLTDADARGRLLVLTDESMTSVVAEVAGEPRARELSWLDRTLTVDLSADGKRLLFVEAGQSAPGESDVWFRDLAGGPAVRLGKGLGMALSFDGSTAIVGPSVPVTRLVAVPTGPGLHRPLPAGPIERYQFAAFFPDGKRLLVVGRTLGHKSRLWIQTLAGGEPIPLSPEGYWLPEEPGTTRFVGPSPDGREVLAVTMGEEIIQPDGPRPVRRIVRIAVDGGAITEVPGIPAEAQPVDWLVDGKSGAATGLLLALPADPRRVRLETFDFRTGARALRREVVDLSPDGAGEITGGLIQRRGDTVVYQVQRPRNCLYVVDGVR